ncbi:MAG: hypothetical protein PHF46_02510 [Candidatus Gracilibacteria bacterium]|nr:hypothetical protein [Candidatus Gracilibacteria bacterium]MDD3120255.1 hypothetical protein [Candidatus Gracilibacteria bacterium]MDD4530006.1 hypothetical protein [Candidatus Gracilibacteria bacterium]
MQLNEIIENIKDFFGGIFIYSKKQCILLKKKYDFLERDKQIIVIIVLISFFVLVITTFIITKNHKEIIKTKINVEKNDYFNNQKVTVSRSKEVEDLKEKMKERGQLQAMTISFNKTDLKIETNGSLKISTMTQIDLDASNTGFPDGTKLMLSIPSAKISSQITIPGRYRFLVNFSKNGEQDVILQGSALKNGKVTKVLQIQ